MRRNLQDFQEVEENDEDDDLDDTAEQISMKLLHKLCTKNEEEPLQQRTFHPFSVENPGPTNILDENHIELNLFH